MDNIILLYTKKGLKLHVSLCAVCLQDHSCLSFSPSSEGELEPLSTTTVTVECQPCQTGQLRSLVQFMVNNEHSR